VDPEKIILFYLTAPPALFIVGILLIELDILKVILELKRFAMSIIILLAAIVALFEKLNKRYEKAKQDI